MYNVCLIVEYLLCIHFCCYVKTNLHIYLLTTLSILSIDALQIKEYMLVTLICCVYMRVLVFQPGYPCGGRGTACQSLFSLSIMWDPGIELTLSGLVISTFTGLVILPVYEYNNFIMKTRTTTKTQPALRLSVFRLLLLATFQSVLLQLRYHCPLYCREMGPVSLDPPIETIFKNINKSAMLLLHLLKDEEGPTSPQTASQLQQPCWDLLLGERNSLSSKSEKHLHSWKLDLPNMENAWVYWKKDYVRKYAELQTQEMSCLNQVPDSNQGSQSCKQRSQVRMSNFFWLLRSSSQLLWAGFLFANQKDHRKYKVSFFSYTAKSIHM